MDRQATQLAGFFVFHFVGGIVIALLADNRENEPNLDY
jgi:hypothetical protein